MILPSERRKKEGMSMYLSNMFFLPFYMTVRGLRFLRTVEAILRISKRPLKFFWMSGLKVFPEIVTM